MCSQRHPSSPEVTGAASARSSISSVPAQPSSTPAEPVAEPGTGPTTAAGGASAVNLPTGQQLAGSMSPPGKVGSPTLRARWRLWGGQLAAAGVNMNLAPVASSVQAVISGMADAGVGSNLKHFPGLGRVRQNTDFGAAQDDSTTTSSADLASFIPAIQSGSDSVMVHPRCIRRWTLVSPRSSHRQ